MSDRLAARDLRLLPIAAAVWATAGAAVAAPHASPVLAAGSLGLAIVALAVAVLRTGASRSGLAALCAVAFAAMTAVAAQVAVTAPERAAAAGLPVDGGRTVTVEATVVGKIEPRGRGWAFDAVTDSVRIGGSARTLTVPIVVRLSGHPDDVQIGATIVLAGTAERAEPARREVLVVTAHDDVQVSQPAVGVFDVAASLRRLLLHVVDGLPDPGAQLIPGLAVGDTSLVTAQLDEAMKTSSLSHLTAVSGANCALVAAAAFGAGALIRLPRGGRIALSAVALGGFVLLVTPEPSVVRAAAMSGIAMIAVLIGRRAVGVSVLGTAIIVCLIADPWLSVSLGFALSAAATAALLLLAPLLAHGLTRWMPEPIALALAVPAAAQLACGPLLILVAPAVPAYGIVANLLAGPAAPAATVLGLLACLCAGVPVMAHGLAALAWVPAAWIAATASTIADLPHATVPWWEGLPGVAALTVCSGAIVVAVTLRRGPLRATAVLLLAAVAGVILAVGPILTGLERWRTPGSWAIVACDVGQGDAILLRDAGHIALIDTGPDPERLTRCLNRFGVDRVDVLVLTHFDADHRGGLTAVRGRVGLLLHGPVPDADAAGALAAAARDGALLKEAAAGDSGPLGDAVWEVLWPRADAAGFEGNDASIVIDIRGGRIPATILLGDLSATPQLVLSARVRPPYEVVKVAHHGSADQAPALYARIRARLALFTVGENTYGHPRQETLDLLTGLDARVLRTDRSGALAVWRDGDAMQLWRERGADGAR